MKKPTAQEVDEFIRESNAIEGVYDEDSYMQAWHAWQYLMKQDVITTGVLLKTHKILMLNSKLQPDQKGYFRTIPVWVGGREGVQYSMIPMMIFNFLFESIRVHPKPDWQALHVTFEHIHPFVDGNGRVGRHLMNWTRLKRCKLPILIIKADERQEYYGWFA